MVWNLQKIIAYIIAIAIDSAWIYMELRGIDSSFYFRFAGIMVTSYVLGIDFPTLLDKFYRK